MAFPHAVDLFNIKAEGIMKSPTFEKLEAFYNKKNLKGTGKSPKELYDFMCSKSWLAPKGQAKQTEMWWINTVAWVKLLRVEHREKVQEIRKAKKAEKREKRREEKHKQWVDRHREFRVAFTDGSCNNLSPHGEGGAAYVILDCDWDTGRCKIIRESAKGFLSTTNNRMEMLAIVSVLNHLDEHSKVIIYSDSLYAINVFTGAWRAKANLDLVKQFCEVKKKMDRVELGWVKGHNGNYWNEYVDKLAEGETAKIREKYGIPCYDYSNSPKIGHSKYGFRK